MTASHETGTTAPEIVFSDAEKAAYSLRGVEQWRTRQMGILNGLREATSDPLDTTYLDTFRGSIDEQLDEYLCEQGLDSSSANYDDLKQAYRNAAIDKINDSNWYASSAARGEAGSGPSGRDAFADLADERLAAADQGTTTTTDPIEPDPVDPRGPYTEAQRDEALIMNAEFDQDLAHANDPSLDQLHEQALRMNQEFDDEPVREALEAALEKAREKWAAVSAKRQGRITSFGIKERKAIEADYHAKANALIAHELRDLLADDNETDELKEVAVIQHLFNEQEALRELTKEKLKGTKLNKFVEFMNRGNLPVRIAKGATVGVAAGFLGTLLAGAVGAGLIAGGAIATSRFVKGYAAHDKEIGTKSFEDTVDGSRLDEYREDITTENRVGKLSGFASEQFEDDTKNEQAKRRKAFAWGAGSVAVGATLGYGIHAVADHYSKSDLQLLHPIDSIKDWFGSDDVKPTAPGEGIGTGTDVGVDVDQDGIDDTNDPIIDSDNDGIADSDEAELDKNDNGIVDSQELNWNDFSHEARLVERGEGWYQTFDEMGIPENHWEDVLEEAGPKLAEQNWAYFDESANEWRISQPGELPNSALRVIAESSKRDGYDLAA